MVANEQFREDLLYRINTVEITLPSLRQRTEDIPLLLDHFLSVYSRKYKKSLSIGTGVVKMLTKYSWPGNIREFQHAVERAVILCSDKQITNKDFHFQDHQVIPLDAITNLTELERKTIADAIKKNNGNMSKAAKELGLGRTTLYRKIEKYGL
jgi:DNA-binding NtrC family response regulator